MLAKAFAEGASAKHHVEILSINDFHINPCIGCNTCFTNNENKCCQKDDMAILYEKMKNTDMLVIASPVYFYGISAQLKTLIDRFHNPVRDSFGIKKMALLLVGAATLPQMFDSIITQYRLCLNFFKIEDAGMVLASGIKDKGEIVRSTFLADARELGQRI